MTLRRTAFATAGSIVAHAAALGALAYSVTPVSVPDQPLPKTAMTIASQQVKQTTAPQADNAGTAADEGTALAPAARQGTVTQTVATAAPVIGSRLSTADPGVPITAPQLQTAVALSAVTPSAATVVAQLEKTAAQPPLSPIVAKAIISAPEPTPLPQSLTTSDIAAAVQPTSMTAQQPPLPARAVRDQPLPSQVQTVALAWSGDGNTVVSATSLAAIAAFSEQGDLTAQSQQVRDGIAGTLSAVPCARLQTLFNPDTGNLELTGHIPEDALRGPVLAALREQVGDAIPLSDNLLILPRPQCGALAGIADIGLPQSTEQLTNPRVIGQDGFAQNYTYSDGQPLQLDLSGPDYDSVVYVDYFAADGTVIHLQPNDVVPLEPLSAKQPMSVGRDRGDEPFLLLSIGAPFGQEIAVAFATSVPLYDGLRPIQEPAGPYLMFLKSQVAAARERHSDFKGEWVYFFITTQPD